MFVRNYKIFAKQLIITRIKFVKPSLWAFFPAQLIIFMTFVDTFMALKFPYIKKNS